MLPHFLRFLRELRLVIPNFYAKCRLLFFCAISALRINKQLIIQQPADVKRQKPQNVADNVVVLACALPTRLGRLIMLNDVTAGEMFARVRQV